MITSLTTFLTAIVVLGVWHAILVAYRGEPGWARTVVRVGLLVTTVVQAVAYVLIQQLSAEVPLERASEVLNQIARWTRLADGTSAVLLGIVGVLLLGLTVRRVWRGPWEPPRVDGDTSG